MGSGWGPCHLDHAFHHGFDDGSVSGHAAGFLVLPDHIAFNNLAQIGAECGFHTPDPKSGHPRGCGREIIEAFGSFIIQDSYVVGIVFAILVIVNFVVITKGSSRIAEVAARFTLDSVPGKQMAIDADMSAGLITEEEAKERRKKLEGESHSSGQWMVAKFVRGDAIAGLLIVFINVIGGIIIGTVFQDMSVAEAAQNYTILTIGDGLVSQIPALIVSVSAGLLVSKGGVEGTTDKIMVEQFGRHPKALIMSSSLMLALGLIPAIPFMPFFVLSAVTGTVAYLSWK